MKNIRVAFTVIFLAMILISCDNQPKRPSVSEKQNDGVNWLTIEEAQNLNKKSPKELMVFVHANWCPKCAKLFKNTFTNEKLIAEANEHFYPVLLNAHQPDDIKFNGKVYDNPDFDKEKGLDQMNSYHNLLFEIEAKSIPSIVFMDSDYNIQGTEMGFKEASELRSLMKMYNSKY